MKNLFICGLPGSGKTSLVSKVIENNLSAFNFGGFVTHEIRKEGKRMGFKIITIPDEEEAILAEKGLSSPYRVGSYGVSIENLEKFGCQAIRKALENKRIIVIDEIGKMELFSQKFKQVLVSALNSPHKVLATIMGHKNEFADKLKKRNDVRVLQLELRNFQNISFQVEEWLRKK